MEYNYTLMTKNLSYIRVAPCGRRTTITPQTDEEVSYYESLEKKGYKYESVIRIHRKPIEECEACSA